MTFMVWNRSFSHAFLFEQNFCTIHFLKQGTPIDDDSLRPMESSLNTSGIKYLDMSIDLDENQDLQRFEDIHIFGMESIHLVLCPFYSPSAEEAHIGTVVVVFVLSLMVQQDD